MFTPRFAGLAFIGLLAIVNVAGMPVQPIERSLALRGPAPFEPIQAYKRDLHVDRAIASDDALMLEKRQNADINTIPEQDPTKAPNGKIIPYAKRQNADINTIPEQDPTKAPNGKIIPYAKRQNADINTIPEQDPTKAPNGKIIPYVKRQNGNVNTIPEEVATQAPQGKLELYQGA
ncbi:hypothetical protein F5148DRAFT_1007650 [Russula earlei]|uniref:Uncharacterized protein n=1 Tax=Russula earlei TaxID=71964 RepID=A0ACC0UML7_9AGAM|nr:hypothetical protein F5148DRAFT_1007650 [Russula earlei]